MIPYGRQWIDDDDIAEVVKALRSDWLTTGPQVDAFEKAFAELVGAKHAVAVSSGTAALHTAMYAIRIEGGDEVVVPAMTFAASANAAVYQGAKPVFADVDPRTLLLTAATTRPHLSPKTRAIVAVDYAGQPCDYVALREAVGPKVRIVSDACHSLGGTDGGRRVGTLADVTAFSFHPVKHITTAEGGMIATDDDELAKRARVFRNHGITSDHRMREAEGSWFYEMVDLGMNYRLTDLQCTLGISQLRKLPRWLERRRQIAARYREAFARQPCLRALEVRPGVEHAYHLFPILLELEKLRVGRGEIFRSLRAEGLGVNVHYVPVHLHPYYRNNFGTRVGQCPVAEDAYERLLSLPMFPRMTDEDVEMVIRVVDGVMRRSLSSGPTAPAETAIRSST